MVCWAMEEFSVSIWRKTVIVAVITLLSNFSPLILSL